MEGKGEGFSGHGTHIVVVCKAEDGWSVNGLKKEADQSMPIHIPETNKLAGENRQKLTSKVQHHLRLVAEEKQTGSTTQAGS